MCVIRRLSRKRGVFQTQKIVATLGRGVLEKDRSVAVNDWMDRDFASVATVLGRRVVLTAIFALLGWR